MKYFDSHAHYYDERFEDELSQSVDELIDALLSESVSHIVNVGTMPSTSRLAIEQAQKHENMYTAIGIHPSDTRFIEDLDAAIAETEALIKAPSSKCVCLGEIGLDYHYPETDKEKQMYCFREQMKLAERLGMPICVHDREAHEDVMSVLRDFPNVKGILHSFSGSTEMARELVKMGYMISFSGTLTFTNARRPKEVAAAIPKECVLIETDAPYLAPHPKRGSLNHSGNLVYTNAMLASIWGTDEETAARITAENAKRVFGIS